MMPDRRRARASAAWIAAAIVFVTVAIYAQTLRFGFVGLDDPGYVTGNPRVLGGLSVSNVAWAATTLTKSNWHPLTWLSLMLDAEIGGGDPAVFHMTSLLLHVAGTLALFVFLARAVGAVWPSGFVAALFAIHPLHVESVAWISERKDVLSSLLLWLALLAWLGWARRRSRWAYCAALGCAALGLMAKPMLVTLPVLLLLLDRWPLERLGPGASWRGLVLEKTPFAMLAAASAAMTLLAQSRGGAVATLELFPPATRVANAAVATVTYLVKMILPTGLAIPYPYDPASLTALTVGGCATALLAASAIAYAGRGSRPWLWFGWLWYLVTLAPVVGLVQVGSQPMADRYTYLPLVGPFVIAVWAAGELAARGRRPTLQARRLVLTGGGVALLLALAVTTHRQVGYWRDSETLFRRAIAVTGDNAVARNGLGLELHARGRNTEAIVELREAVRISPAYAEAHANLGAALVGAGEPELAIGHYREAMRLGRGSAEIRATLGRLLLERGTELLKRGALEEAREELQSAVDLAPEDASAHGNLGVVLARQGRLDEAIEHLETAHGLDPRNDGVLANLERARRMAGDRSREATTR